MGAGAGAGTGVPVTGSTLGAVDAGGGALVPLSSPPPQAVNERATAALSACRTMSLFPGFIAILLA